VYVTVESGLITAVPWLGLLTATVFMPPTHGRPLRMQLSPARTLTVTGTFAVVVALWSFATSKPRVRALAGGAMNDSERRKRRTVAPAA
jgi:hypothetical protein